MTHRKLLTITAILTLLAGAVALAAIGPIRTADPQRTGGVHVLPLSTAGAWVTVHDDARTAQAETDLLNPTAVDDAVCHWVRLDRAASKICHLRCKVPIATTAVGTSPVVRVYLGYGALNEDGSVPTTGGFRVERLDNADPAAEGLTLAFEGSPSAGNQMHDAAWYYSRSVLQEPTDLRGADYLIVLVETAGVCTASAAMPIEACFVN